MHASLMIEGRNLMASDSPAGQHKPMQGFALSLFYDTPEEARAKFDILAGSPRRKGRASAKNFEDAAKTEKGKSPR